MEENKRMPRPEGTTLLCMEIHKASSTKKKQERKENLLRHLVNVYTMNGFRINGFSLSLSQFSNLLGVKQEKIQSILFEKASTLKAFSDPDQLKQTANTLASMCTMWAIQDRGLLQTQAENMLRAQDGSYKPFISSEVRQTLSALLQSNKQVAEIFKTFYSQGGININMTQTTQKQENYLTIDKAYEIARESTPKPLKPANPAQAQILSESVLKEIAEVNHLDQGSNILKQYEHLDNSGWDKARSLPQPTKQEKIQSIETIGVQYKESTNRGAIDSDSEYQEVEVLDTYREYNKGVYGTESGKRSEEESRRESDTGEGTDFRVNPATSDKEKRHFPAALKMGILPDPEAVGPSLVEVPGGCIAPSVVRIPKKKRPKPDTTKRPKNHTLSGIKLGSKTLPDVIRTGTSTETEYSNPDNLDRHLKSDKRRNIARVEDDSLPSRS